MRHWRAAGEDPSLFWRLTWREIDAVLAGAADQRKREHNDRAWLAWHIAVLGRARRMPRLRQLTAEMPKRRARMSPEEQEASLRVWMQFGRPN